MSDAEEFQEFLEIFQEESLERMVNVSRALEALSGGPHEAERAAQLDEIDRELHTIKGSARLLGFMELAQLVHELEGLARGFRKTPQLGLELLVESSDRLSSLIDEASTSGQDVTDEGLRMRVALALGEAPPARREAPEPAAEPASGELPESDHTQIMQRPELPPPSTRFPARVEDEAVRVRASRLAHLDGIVSEFSLAQQRLEAHETRLRDLTRTIEGGSDPALVHSTLSRLVQDYRTDLLQIHTSTQSLERLAVDVRLRPASYLFDRIPREARELARRLNKRVRVRVRGEDTELDRVILEALKSPLTHVLRNAIDHGLESPAERIAAGKDPEGLLDISAGQEGSQVAIRIEDDGAGIDPVRIRTVAVERGLLDQRAAAELTDDEACQLLFAPGFSTRSVATEISGRGVGMNAIRTVVEQLKGEVRISSQPGRGTQVVLRLPLTLLISRVTLVRSGGQQFALPTETVEESVRLPKSKIAIFGEHPAVLRGDVTIPLLNLATLLGHRRLPDPEFLRVLIVRHAGERLALSVDEVLEERSVVVKPLGWPLALLVWIAGAILQPDGEIALQLHVPQLFAGLRRGVAAPLAAPKLEGQRTILVVDDSIVSRQLVARTVASLGFEPLLAVDGVEAWSLLERIRPELVVTDVEMPRLDGLGLVRRIRRDERLGGLPIIIFSNRGALQDRQAGLEAGADAYITKAEFNKESFRDVIERML